MSDDDNISMEEALDADDTKTKQNFLICQMDSFKERLDNGISEQVEANTRMRKFFKRAAWVVLPLALTSVGVLFWHTFV